MSHLISTSSSFKISVSISGTEGRHLTSATSQNRATGVAFAPNPLFHPDGPFKMRTVRGTKLVVISAGSLGSPGILERSGIGAKDVLEGVGVKQRVNSPGVGENYQGPPSDTSSVTGKWC
jgi:choline dehydrogenase-like flavoprotein